MSDNLDRALDDIIQDNSSRGRQRPKQGRRPRHSDHSSPYSRDNRRSRRGLGPRADQWQHDQYDSPRSINDRLGSQRSSGSLRGGRGRVSRHTNESQETRGISIAGRNRDTTAYDEVRVVWVTGIPQEYTQEKLENMFRDAGRIDKIRMAIDRNDRFVGKAEIEYRLPDDARNAIQVFDGEMLYTVDSRQVMMHVTYSGPENSAYIDDLKFENTLPTPREIPVEQRLGSAVPIMNPMIPMVPMGMMPAFSMPFANQNTRDGRRRDGHSSNGGHWRGGGHSNRGRRNATEARSQVTAEQLDAEMEEYMNSAADKKNEEVSAPAAEAPQAGDDMETN
ncbi:hypothetical protein H4S02_000630 [Coemansia sp. RSA 2611]|nr:hypothetical protein H4S02_000630 [Coemansia sp. RSA 2611]